MAPNYRWLFGVDQLGDNVARLSTVSLRYFALLFESHGGKIETAFRRALILPPNARFRGVPAGQSAIFIAMSTVCGWPGPGNYPAPERMLGMSLKVPAGAPPNRVIGVFVVLEEHRQHVHAAQFTQGLAEVPNSM